MSDYQVSSGSGARGRRSFVYADLDDVEGLDGDRAIYRRLWSAVLLQAIRDLSAVYRREEEQKPNREDAGFSHRALREWFASDDMEPKTFRWICTVLGLDCEDLRRRLLDNPHVLTGTRKS